MCFDVYFSLVDGVHRQHIDLGGSMHDDAARVAAAETTCTVSCYHLCATELMMKHTGIRCAVRPVLPDNGLVFFSFASCHLRLFVRGAGSRISIQWVVLNVHEGCTTAGSSAIRCSPPPVSGGTCTSTEQCFCARVMCEYEYCVVWEPLQGCSSSWQEALGSMVRSTACSSWCCSNMQCVHSA